MEEQDKVEHRLMVPKADQAFVSTRNNDTLVNSDREGNFRLTTND